MTDTDDVANATPGAGNDSLDVSVAETNLGDTVSVTLSESISTPGLIGVGIETTYPHHDHPGSDVLFQQACRRIEKACL